MKALGQLVIRQSSKVVFFCLLFALLCGIEVCQGLWQGSGLHGYVNVQSKYHTGQMVSVWTEFTQMLAALGIAGLFGVIARFGSSMGFGIEKARVVENPGRENVLRTRRRQRRRR